MNESASFSRPRTGAAELGSGLEVRSIAKTYDRRAVLHDVSLDVHGGEVVGLLGPNGAGKTTCFYSVMGLVKPDSGRIFLDGEDITGLPMYRRAILGLGYLPQETSIFRGLTVEDNIRAVLEVAEPDRAERSTRLERLLDEFGLTGLRDSPAMALSGGERRRCEIARALAADPSIMLLDEPFAGIDPISIADIRDLVKELKERGIGVLITDHNVRETLDIVDRACIIYDGQVLFAGTPEALVADAEVRQSQSLVLTPQLAQAIKLLQLSNLELEAFVAEELAKNPLLEARSDEDGDSFASDEPEPGGDEAPDDPGADQLILGQADDDRPLDRDWDSEALETDSLSDLSLPGESGEAFDFDRLEYSAGSLAEHLLGQLHGASGTVGRLARLIAEMLDETGYLTVAVEDIAADTGEEVELVERALELVQGLDPPGVGARSLAECLALQAKAADRYDPAMARLIDNLDLLAKARVQDLKRICGVDDEDFADMVRELRGYDPKPGCRFGQSAADNVAPDVLVRRTGKGFSVELNPATLPRLLVNRTYYAELKRGPQDKASRAWLSECLQSASWLVKALDQRARTIVKVVSAIVERQQAFFDHGVSALRPLTLREVAAAIGMHESTVSRVTSNKYLLSERGMFELKYFFGSGVASAEGDGAAAEAVKAEIKRLIDAETEVLSDDAIAALLKAKGLDVARRTVVKYRESMGIGSSIQRRRQRKIAG